MLRIKLYFFFLIPLFLFTNLFPLPLFDYYPNLHTNVPHIELAILPTPVTKLEKLGANLGVKKLYLKNDGLTGKLFGGNKVRKLEFLLADALEKKAKSVVTIGDASSNHALATIIYAKTLGLDAYSVLSPQPNTTCVRRNLLMSSYYGGNISHYETPEERDSVVNDLLEKLKTEDASPYFVPGGGSCPLGALGYVNAAFELKKQIDEGLLPEPDYIYVTLGSSGTAAGLLLGLKLAQVKSKVIPVRISGVPEVKTQTLLKLVNETCEFLHELNDAIPLLALEEKDLLINHDFAGNGFAEITSEAASAIKALFDTEGIKLDGEYAGKTFAAMLDDLKKEEMKDKNVLFWNTFCAGDFSEITEQVDYERLPKELHCYFEQDVQELDQGVNDTDKIFLSEFIDKKNRRISLYKVPSQEVVKNKNLYAQVSKDCTDWLSKEKFEYHHNIFVEPFFKNNEFVSGTFVEALFDGNCIAWLYFEEVDGIPCFTRCALPSYGVAAKFIRLSVESLLPNSNDIILVFATNAAEKTHIDNFCSRLGWEYDEYNSAKFDSETYFCFRFLLK
ncbi:pyridoxal-phosphate dependent enzyme [Candidatus Babeliales bacterium]|nr:pyridoxal-phosphate dependent enzyme [Candidatus Babeliales bacterium]